MSPRFDNKLWRTIVVTATVLDLGESYARDMTIWQAACLEAMRGLLANPTISKWSREQISEIAMNHADTIVDAMEASSRTKLNPREITLEQIFSSLNKNGNNKCKTAREFGISVNTIYQRIKKARKHGSSTIPKKTHNSDAIPA